METLKLLKEMVSIPSVTADIKNVNKTSNYVAKYLKANGLYVKIESFDGYKIVYAANHKSKKSDVLLNSHIDVVSAEKSQFEPFEKSGKIYGRGVLDCKGHAAVIMNLLIKLKGSSQKVGAIFSSDEEVGGLTTKYMVSKGYNGKFTIVLDGNMDRVIIAQKGILGITLTAKGKACHASAPWRGENALEKVMLGYFKIKKLFPKATEKKSWQNTCEATIINCGTVQNVIPGDASLTINVRYTEKTNPKELVKKIKEVSGLNVKLYMHSPYTGVSEKNKDIQKFYKSMKLRLNKDIKIGKMNGATDARFFVKTCKAVVITGLKGGNVHGKDEFLYIKTIDKMEKAILEYITEDL